MLIPQTNTENDKPVATGWSMMNLACIMKWIQAWLEPSFPAWR